MGASLGQGFLRSPRGIFFGEVFNNLFENLERFLLKGKKHRGCGSIKTSSQKDINPLVGKVGDEKKGVEENNRGGIGSHHIEKSVKPTSLWFSRTCVPQELKKIVRNQTRGEGGTGENV